SPGYFEALGVPLLRGRLFTEQDAAGGERVALVDRLLAERYWPDADPIGKRIFRGQPGPNAVYWTIVGVVPTMKNANLDLPVTKDPISLPLAQAPSRFLTLVVKPSGSPGGLVAPVRAAVLAADPEQPLFDIKTMEARLDESMVGRRSPMILLGVFA